MKEVEIVKWDDRAYGYIILWLGGACPLHVRLFPKREQGKVRIAWCLHSNETLQSQPKGTAFRWARRGKHRQREGHVYQLPTVFCDTKSIEPSARSPSMLDPYLIYLQSIGCTLKSDTKKL